MAERLHDACAAACRRDEITDTPLAPWFCDPSLDMPFALPSVAGSEEESSQMSIGELMVKDLQSHVIMEILELG